MPPRCLLIALLSMLPSQAALLIVDPAHPAASDDNPGTAERPLRSIASTVSRVQPGDTVEVAPGIYRESVPLVTSGEPGRPITYRAREAGTAILSGADVVSGWERVPGDAPIYQVPWDKVFAVNHKDGVPIEHHPENAPLWGRAELVIVDEQQAVPTGGLEELRQAWAARPPGPVKQGTRPVPDFDEPATWPAMFAVDTRGAKALYLALADGSDPNRQTVEAGVRPVLFGQNVWSNREGLHDVVVHGFVFRHAPTFPQRGSVWLHGRDNLLQACTIEGHAGGGVTVHGVMRDCTLIGNGHVGGGATGHGFTNLNCRWLYNCWKPISRGWDAGGQKIARCSDGLFRGCVFYRNGGPGLWLDIDVRDVMITECLFLENEQSGLFIEISRDCTVERNLFVRNAVGVVPTPGGKPGWGAAGVKLAESMNCVLAYNTCYGNLDGISIREQGPRTLDTAEHGAVGFRNLGHIIVGNVCAANQGYPLALWYDNAFFGPHPSEKDKYPDDQAWKSELDKRAERVFDPRQAGLTIARNLYQPAASGAVLLFGVPWREEHQVFVDLAGCRESTGFESGTVVADPRLAAPEQGDFRFREDSPAMAMEAGWRNAPPLAEWKLP